MCVSAEQPLSVFGFVIWHLGKDSVHENSHNFYEWRALWLVAPTVREPDSIEKHLLLQICKHPLVHTADPDQFCNAGTEDKQ